MSKDKGIRNKRKYQPITSQSSSNPPRRRKKISSRFKGDSVKKQTNKKETVHEPPPRKKQKQQSIDITHMEIEKQNSSQKLEMENALGSDENLSTNIGDRYYLYSVTDIMVNLLHLRKKFFTYSNQAIIGEEFSALRENNEAIFLADPYHIENFQGSLKDDVGRIVLLTSNVRWGNYPKTIIIPLLSGRHWRCIRIQVNYIDRIINILWDDPFGLGGFTEELKSKIINSIIACWKNYIFGHVPRVYHVEKAVDQQGCGENSWDCGAIILSNIEAYISYLKHKSNSELRNGNLLSIKSAALDNKNQLLDARAAHMAIFENIFKGISLNEGRINSIKKILNAERDSIKEDISSYGEISRKVNNLSDSEFDLLLIEYNKIQSKKPRLDSKAIYQEAFEVLQDKLKERDSKIVPNGNSNYILFSTSGNRTIKPNGEDIGDDSYAKWLDNSFTTLSNAGAMVGSGCVYYKHIISPVSTNAEFDESFTKKFLNVIKKNLEATEGLQAQYIVLNWHMRFTGQQRSWTGRGLHPDLIREIKRYLGETLILVLTVHEINAFETRMCRHRLWDHIDGIITLNNTIKSEVSRLVASYTKHTKSIKVYQSAVPNLMTSHYGRIADNVLSYLKTPKKSEAQDLGIAYTLHELKKGPIPVGKGLKKDGHGIVIFGSVSKRHNLTTENIEVLLNSLREKGLLPGFQIAIAGQVTKAEKQLANSLRGIGNVQVLGRIETLDVLANYRYAVSFDPLGFRTNASAMVNLIRAGIYLFPKKESEEVTSFVNRVVDSILIYERQEGNYITGLSKQQPLFRELDAGSIARGLLDIFADIVKHKQKDKQIGGRKAYNNKH